ncbi:hypothetical protein ACFLQX_00685 [Bacteroidota bacterium]
MNEAHKKPEVFIHTGMGRTGTTFLQHKVFPKFEKIFFHPQVKFRKAVKVIKKGDYQRYLISGEMEYKKLDKHMKEFSVHFPDARPIIMLRRHDEWIASQHRRFVKSGYALKFQEFFNAENDSGFWERDWLRFKDNIEILEKYYTYKPLVLFFDDLKKKPHEFILNLAEYLGARVHLPCINLTPKHASYNEKQLRAVYTVSKKISLRKRKPSNSKAVNVMINLLRNLLRYTILFLAPAIPNSWLSTDQFLPDSDQLKKIREQYTPDWEACIQYAEMNNPTFSV